MNDFESKNQDDYLPELERPNDFTNPDDLYDELITTILRHHPGEDLSLLHRAYMTAKNAHMDQKRKSGEPYVIHPLCVALILADLDLDMDTIIAGLLHDIIEDTILNKSQLARIFGPDVAELVDGVTKLTEIDINGNKSEEQAENLRKMFLAMAKDIRVLLIKLADRLHNMRTLKYMKPEKQKEKAKETMDIYSPLADRLGISKIKIELDDLALKYIKPDEYSNLDKTLTEKMGAKEAFIEELVEDVRKYMEEAEIKADVKGRVKHYFSIYKKMVRQQKTVDQIYDIFAVRVIVDTVRDCYAALGVIHEHYTPVPGRFKDYIAMPKPNMYQSIHTTVIGRQGQPFEIQIRTWEMHRTAEYGIAAHWKYKESGDSKGTKGVDDEKMNWLRQILELQTDTSDNTEFLNVVKSDLDIFSDSVYCFSPTGEVKTLPAGSTPIDFAYMIHSAVGNRMVGARVNGQLVNIDYKLCNGDRVEIVTSQNSKGPSRDWLKIVKSSQAKSKINQWFRAELKEENIARGRELVEKYAKSHQINLQDIMKPEIVEKVTARYSAKDWDSLLATIGHGGLKEGQIVNKMVDIHDKNRKKEITDEQVMEVLNEASESKPAKLISGKNGNGITVQGTHDVAVRLSRCCSPVPGDEIVGFVTRGRGVTIHRTDCINMIALNEDERARLIPAEWQDNGPVEGVKYLAEITVYAKNRVGLMVDLSKNFTERGIDIIKFNSNIGKNGIATMNLSFEIKSVEELNSIIEKLRQISGVVDIERTTG